ncbi:hypothetical protein B0J12DRAFT_316303 [Macrophomina phaseolina]|uniref:Uncharacterized protein n=1 Tax=Macrophomina phaseolina TaxID=35725 RepID=A0ABQ8FWX7_9PEZI|nr:hypothetical protein B0J12DRAFT_316303 [Macrophomina phaseolina]
MAAQGNLSGNGARAVTIELEGVTEGERKKGAERRIARLGPATALPGPSARGGGDIQPSAWAFHCSSFCLARPPSAAAGLPAAAGPTGGEESAPAPPAPPAEASTAQPPPADCPAADVEQEADPSPTRAGPPPGDPRCFHRPAHKHRGFVPPHQA